MEKFYPAGETDYELMTIKARLGEIYMLQQKLLKEIEELTQRYDDIKQKRDEARTKAGRNINKPVPINDSKLLYATPEQVEEMLERLSLDKL